MNDRGLTEIALPAELASTLMKEFSLEAEELPAPRATVSPINREVSKSLKSSEFALSSLRTDTSRHTQNEAVDPAVNESTLGSSSASVSLGALPRIVLAGEEQDGENAELAITAPLGQGGMGVVELAKQLAFGRIVAAKRVRPDRQCVSAYTALAHEAAVTGALDHPNIVPSYLFGVTRTHEPLLVMKRVQGVTWAALLRDPDHPGWKTRSHNRLERNLELLIHVCNAIESAHRQGILHRDLKPENVMVGELGEVYVLDWGLALRPSDPRSNALAGTPAYMAPEMLEGSTDVTTRTDVYLLGGMLHEVLTGSPPHPGEHFWQVLASVYEAAPYAYGPDVPVELAAICTRALARRPEDRFASALDLRNALEQFLRHRGSLELCVAGERKALELATLLQEHAVGTNKIERSAPALFAEADFAFRQALQSWPENDRARAARQRCLRTMLEYELRQRNAPGARTLLIELDPPSSELEARVAALETERAAEANAKAELELERHARNPAVAARERALSWAIACALAAGISITFELLGRPFTHGAFGTVLVLVLVLTLATGVVQPAFKANESNRQTQKGTMILLALSVLATLLGVLDGTSAEKALSIYGLLGMSALFAAANFSDPQILVLLPTYIPIAVLPAVWPGHGWTTFAVGCLTGVVMAIPRLLLRQYTANEHST